MQNDQQPTSEPLTIDALLDIMQPGWEHRATELARRCIQQQYQLAELRKAVKEAYCEGIEDGRVGWYNESDRAASDVEMWAITHAKSVVERIALDISKEESDAN